METTELLRTAERMARRYETLTPQFRGVLLARVQQENPRLALLIQAVLLRAHAERLRSILESEEPQVAPQVYSGSASAETPRLFDRLSAFGIRLLMLPLALAAILAVTLVIALNELLITPALQLVRHSSMLSRKQDGESISPPPKHR